MVAEALIIGCIEHFGGDYDLVCEDAIDAAGPLARFHVTRKVEVPA